MKIYKHWEMLAGWILSSVIILFVMELSLGVYYKSKDIPQDYRISLSPYKTDWGSEYWSEYKKSVFNQEYKPFYLWSTKPFVGKFVNVDNNGDRITQHNSKSVNSKKVFLFGGSTMWGDGSPDDMTIPSHLAKILNKRDNYRIYNFGQPGHTSTQEMMRLIVELKNNNIPNYVIFLDGGNDSSMGLINPRRSDAHLQYNHISDSYNLSFDYLKMHYLGSFNIVRFLSELKAQATSLASPTLTPKEYANQNHDKTLQTISNIESNVKVIKSLSSTYGFKYIHYMQPTMASKIGRSDEEDFIFANNKSSEIMLAYNAIHDALKGRKTPLLDISAAFDGVSDTTFIDPIHYSPIGNKIIANIMYNDILKSENSTRSFRAIK